MKPSDFNESTQIPRYSYTRSPVNERAFLIMALEEVGRDPEPVGDYTVLDNSEDLTLSEKKVMNLIALMNGKEGKVIDLGDDTQSKLFYKVISEGEGEEKAKLMFFENRGEGVSKENALFRIESDHVSH